MPQFRDSDELCAHIREIGGDYVAVSMSGKDSFAMMLQLRKFWDKDKIIPIHGYLVPGMRHIEESLRDFERQLGQHIYRLPHPFLYHFLTTYTFNTPHGCTVVERANLPQYNWDLVFEVLKNELHLPDETWMAVGVTMHDSQMRAATIKKYGAMNNERRTFFGIYDWNLERIAAELQNAGWVLPQYYRLYGRSLDGLDYRFVHLMKKHYPDDYALLLKWWPLLECEIKRIQYREEAMLYAD